MVSSLFAGRKGLKPGQECSHMDAGTMGHLRPALCRLRLPFLSVHGFCKKNPLNADADALF
jgi:hypothetical protein